MAKRSTKKKKSSRLKKAVAAIVVLAAVVVAGYFLFFHHQPQKMVNITETSSGKQYATPPASVNDDNNSRKSNPSSAAQTLDNGPTATSPTSSPAIAVTVTRAGVVGSNLQVGTLISGATTGTCVLSVSQAGETTITATDNVTLQTNSYVCPVFDVPVSSFPNQGDWNVSVTLTSGGSTVTGQWGDNPVPLSN